MSCLWSGCKSVQRVGPVFVMERARHELGKASRVSAEEMLTWQERDHSHRGPRPMGILEHRTLRANLGQCPSPG